MNTNIIRVQTAIIGAGLSSIAASINLLDNNYENFLVFEALERIGGRVFTDRDEKGYLEIGAQWIHGQKGNPIYEIAQKHGLVANGFEHVITAPKRNPLLEDNNINFSDLKGNKLLNEFDVKTDNQKTLFATQHGKRIPYEFAQSVYDMLTNIILEAETFNIDYNSKYDDRVGDYIYERFSKIADKEMLKLESQLSHREVRRLLHGLFVMRCKRENIRSGCSNLFNLSLKNFSAYKEFEGHSYVELKHGFGPVIDKVIDKHREKFLSRVFLKHHLKRIYLSDELCEKTGFVQSSIHSSLTNNDKNKVVLHVCNASNPNEPKDFYVICDNVLCTMSLGYWKENINHIVHPISLISDERRQAVSRLGFGTTNKIFLFYEQPFWNKDLKLVNMIWLPDEDVIRVDKVAHHNRPRKQWYEDICKFEVVNSYPNALSGWISGSEEFEKLSDRDIALECTRLLRKFLGNESIPEPKSIIRTKWNSNIYSRGSYSHLPLGSTPMDYQALSKPVPCEKNPLVMFAGEHTQMDHFSTVHGAYLSGIRESERILRNHNPNSNL